MAINLDKYHTEVLRKLEGFKFAKEWSDFVGLLDSLCQIFRKYKADYVPWIPQLVKRLNQLLNPALPGGVHLKTIECYKVIFECISRENFLKDFDVLTIGIFGFALHCRIIVAADYLELLEMIIACLGSKIEPFSHYMILGFLPFLESESSEFFNKAYGALEAFLDEISETEFYRSLWRNFIDYPELRICILNFLGKRRIVVIPEYNLVSNALCVGMESDNPYIVRTLLEISSRDFPFSVVPRHLDDAQDAVQNASGNDLERRVMESDAAELKTLQDGSSGRDDLASSRSTADLESPPVQSYPKPQQTIRDLASDRLGMLDGELREEAVAEMRECNTQLIKHVLKIFLKKEVGINKRAYKWLNLGESISEHDVDYLERGLRTYLEGSEDDLLTFFRIINSLGYRDNLIVFLMERFSLDIIRMLRSIEISGRADVLVGLKKHARIFLGLSLDELYRVFYTSLQKAFGECQDLEDHEEDRSSEASNVSSSPETVSTRSLALSHPVRNEAEDLLKHILYSIETLDAVDSNAESIHIPLLCHLVVRNRRKISGMFFFYFMNTFLEKSERLDGHAASEVSLAQIDSFYRKENSKDLLEICLVGSLAKLFSNLEMYMEASVDPIYWSSSDMVLQDGVLVWAQNKDVLRVERRKGSFFNFHCRDIELIHRFIRKHGFKDFAEEFLATVGRYLCFNYMFIGMVETLRFYVDVTTLNISLWNDFIVSKNPRFLMFYGEDQLLPFLSDILPTVSMRDICIFLKQAMATGSFMDILFKVASIADTKSGYFMDVLVNAQCAVPLMRYLLDKFYEHQAAEQASAERQPRFDIIHALLAVVEILTENKSLRDILRENLAIDVQKFGSIGILDALMNMIHAIIVSDCREFSPKEHYLIPSSEDCNSVLFECGTSPACGESESSGRASRNAVVPYRKDGQSIDDSLRLINRSSVVVQLTQIHKMAFSILYKLHKRHIPIRLPEMDRIKDVIRRYRENYCILKRTIFLVSPDVEFIFENYMHFYKSIFAVISEMEIKDRFFAHMTKTSTNCPIEIILEAFQYFLEPGVPNAEELFSKVMSIMTKECRRSCVVYKNMGCYYHRVSEQAIDGARNCSPGEDEIRTECIYRAKIDADQMCSMAGEDASTQALVLLYTGDLSAVIKLSELLHKKSPAMFASTFPDTPAGLFLFGILPFKADVFRRLLSAPRPSRYPLKLLRMLAQTIPTVTKKEIIRGEADYLRSSLGLSTLDISGMQLALELFKGQGTSDLSRIVLANIMHCLETRVDSVLRTGAKFDEEMRILSKLCRADFMDQSMLGVLKQCLFELLNSRYQERALEIIFEYIHANRNSKIFIDAYVQYFNRSFFGFGLELKRRIFMEISSSINFDPFAVLESLLSGMDSSFFMSAQSEEMLKIASLQRMSFLILVLPKNRFSTMSDSLVSLVNSLIGASSEIKVEILKLCTSMVLKIDHCHILTLYPILVGDFMNTVLSKDLKVVREMFRFLDVSVWMNSPVFNFKVLFIEDHHFNKQLKLQISHEYTPPRIDYRQSKLPCLLSMFGDKITSWSQLAMYLNTASSYYSYMAEHLVERDFERVESGLIESYLERK